MCDNADESVFIVIKKTDGDNNICNVVTNLLINILAYVDTIYTFVVNVITNKDDEYTYIIILKCNNTNNIDASSCSYIVFDINNGANHSSKFLDALNIDTQHGADYFDMLYTDNISAWYLLLDLSDTKYIKLHVCALEYTLLRDELYKRERNLTNNEICDGLKSFMPNNYKLAKLFNKSSGDVELANAETLHDKIDNLMHANNMEELGSAWARGKKHLSLDGCRIKKKDKKQNTRSGANITNSATGKIIGKRPSVPQIGYRLNSSQSLRQVMVDNLNVDNGGVTKCYNDFKVRNLCAISKTDNAYELILNEDERGLVNKEDAINRLELRLIKAFDATMDNYIYIMKMGKSKSIMYDKYNIDCANKVHDTRIDIIYSAMGIKE